MKDRLESLYEQRKREEARRKKKLKRRQKDTVQGMPLLMAYQADPARDYRCAMYSFREYYYLVPKSKMQVEKNPQLKGFNLLNKYKKHAIEFIGSECKGAVGIIHIKNAPTFFE